MNNSPSQGATVQTVPELLAHALAMETEAAERYGELADQMEMHRRTAVAAIFRRLESAEKKHLVDLAELCKGVTLPHYAPGISPGAATKHRRPSPPTVCTTTFVREAILLLEHERAHSLCGHRRHGASGGRRQPGASVRRRGTQAYTLAEAPA
jgi:hypothetical protein